MSKTATREAYGKALAGLISKRKDIIVLDADLSKSTKTSEAKAVCPNQHFNMGIAEANMMGVAAGLAASGKTVFASSFAMFAAGRAYEQIRNSIAYPKLNIKICATHAGLAVGEDGASHQCIEDLALMRVIPNMVVIQPCDDIQTREVIECIADYHGPCYVRLGRSAVETVYDEDMDFQIGKGNVLRAGKKVAIIACGIMVEQALAAYDMLKEKGYEPPIHDFSMISLDTGEDITDSVLTDKGYTFLLVAHRIEEADDSNIDLINEIYDYSVEHGYGFYALTSSPDEEIEMWRERTGAEYPFCQMDDITLKTIIRSNPGLLLIKDGTILNKWSDNQLPDEYVLNDSLDKLELGQQKQENKLHTIGYVLLWFIVPLTLVVGIDILIIKRRERKSRERQTTQSADNQEND